MTRPEARVDRRRLLQGGAAGAAGVVGGWLARDVLDGSDGPDQGTGVRTVPFHGDHQAGVATPAQAHVSLVGLDLRVASGSEDLARLLRLWSDDAARLTTARPALADVAPELAAVASRLTVTIGLGPRVFTEVLRHSPRGAVTALPGFATDRLLPRWGQTDLLLQLGSDDPVALSHARTVLARDARSLARARWVQDGFRDARGTRPDGSTGRNLFGQVDGTVNPVAGTADFDRLVWVDGGRDEPLAGGTQMVVRRIAMDLDGWEKVDRAGRELTIGRRLDNGAPLGGRRERDDPDFDAVDSLGLPVIDPASHLRRARSDDPAQRILRRGYNYDEIVDGSPDAGLLFCSFQADLVRQFVPLQQRIADSDRLNRWVRTIGSAVYTVPPGCEPGGFVGDRLLGATRGAR
jgi:dye decolorizing peroxidase